MSGANPPLSRSDQEDNLTHISHSRFGSQTLHSPSAPFFFELS